MGRALFLTLKEETEPRRGVRDQGTPALNGGVRDRPNFGAGSLSNDRSKSERAFQLCNVSSVKVSGCRGVYSMQEASIGYARLFRHGAMI